MNSHPCLCECSWEGEMSSTAVQVCVHWMRQSLNFTDMGRKQLGKYGPENVTQMLVNAENIACHVLSVVSVVAHANRRNGNAS